MKPNTAKVFIGTWKGPDEYCSVVEYTVSNGAKGLSVSAVDPDDGETAEISDIVLHSDSLTFRALWRSTGRVASCRFDLPKNGQLTLTFTYTDKAVLVKKSGKPSN